MSNVFFFRLHNLQRREEERRREREQQNTLKAQRNRSKGLRFQWSQSFVKSCNHLTLAPGRLFEKAPPTPTDSLDEVEMQIPR